MHGNSHTKVLTDVLLDINNIVAPSQVPGGAFESLSSNTKLGRAVQEACDELETLSGLVRQSNSVCAWHST